jgi:hypothetical protein
VVAGKISKKAGHAAGLPRPGQGDRTGVKIRSTIVGWSRVMTFTTAVVVKASWPPLVIVARIA